MATYDNPLRMVYQIDAATVSSAADLLKVAGPKGMEGRLVAITTVVTTGVTVAASDIDVGDGTTGDKFGTLVLPISAADAVANDPTILTSDDVTIPADSLVVISTDGAATAGAVNVSVVIDWF